MSSIDDKQIDIIIVGGGIAGLTAAWCLHQANPARRIVVLEQAPQWGGKIQTLQVHGFTLDMGAEAVLSHKPEVRELCRELGIETDLISTCPASKRVYLCGTGGLQLLPEGMTMLVPTRVMPFLLSPVISPLGKLRMGLELFIPPRTGDGDESVASFIGRRLGQEAVQRLGEPILGSIFGGDIHHMSLQATLPMLKDMERQHGGLLKAMLKTPTRRPRSGSSPFASLRLGLGQLIDALVARLTADHVELRNPVQVQQISHADEQWQVHLGNGEVLTSPVCIVAIPTPQAAALLQDVDATLTDSLKQIRYGSAATVCLAWRRGDVRHPLDASGFVVSPKAGRSLTACTWTSSKWADRGPNSHVLMRASVNPTIAAGLSEDDLKTVACRDLQDLLGIQTSPDLAIAARFEPSTPHYEVNHLARVDSILARVARHPGLHLTGSGYRGSGIPDCIRHARQTAAAVHAGVTST